MKRFAIPKNSVHLLCFCRNKLRSRPAMMSPPPNAFATPAVGLPPNMPAELGLPNGQRNQENLGAPFPIPSQGGSTPLPPGKQQTLARRRVLPQQQGTQFREGSAARSDSSLSSSSSSTSGSSSSPAIPRPSVMPVRRAPAGQGMAGTAPRAAAQAVTALKPRTTRDSEVGLPLLFHMWCLANQALESCTFESYCIPRSGRAGMHVCASCCFCEKWRVTNAQVTQFSLATRFD